MNLLNLIQSLIIVSTPIRVPRCRLLIAASDRRSTRRIHDSRTQSGGGPAGAQSLRLLRYIPCSGKSHRSLRPSVR